MANQNYDGLVRWLIIDDGQESQPISFSSKNWVLEVIKPKHRWRQGLNTQQKNLLEGLSQVDKDENLVIIEDDDYYHPDYLQTVESWLKYASLVGECNSRYYNVSSKKYRELPNYFHSSLCSTAMRDEALEFFRLVCKENESLIDLNLWKKYTGTKKLHRTDLVTGIKGLPGRMGIGIGHKAGFQGKIDKDGAVLSDWLKDDVTLYERY
jgi:glycosyltransferase involved in cell wall biosynthesis